MRAWLDFAEGPLFRFAFAIMILGLIRLVVISIAGIIRTRHATPDKSTNIGAQIINDRHLSSNPVLLCFKLVGNDLGNLSFS